MKNIAVIYKSYYGTTKRYAEWIAAELNASLFEASDIKPAQLLDYDVVIYGGGLYAGGIIGSKLVEKNQCKSLVLFTVGLATPETTDYTGIMAKSFSVEQLSMIKVFHLHGGIDYKKLGIVHRIMMAVVKRKAERTPTAERTSDDNLLLQTYGGRIDFTDRETIKPIVDYINTLQG